jgi:hypothetical protein
MSTRAHDKLPTSAIGLSLVGHVQSFVYLFCHRDSKKDTQKGQSTMLPQAKALGAKVLKY